MTIIVRHSDVYVSINLSLEGVPLCDKIIFHCILCTEAATTLLKKELELAKIRAKLKIADAILKALDVNSHPNIKTIHRDERGTSINELLNLARLKAVLTRNNALKQRKKIECKQEEINIQRLKSKNHRSKNNSDSLQYDSHNRGKSSVPSSNLLQSKNRLSTMLPVTSSESVINARKLDNGNTSIVRDLSMDSHIVAQGKYKRKSRHGMRRVKQASIYATADDIKETRINRIRVRVEKPSLLSSPHQIKQQSDDTGQKLNSSGSDYGVIESDMFAEDIESDELNFSTESDSEADDVASQIIRRHTARQQQQRINKN